MRKPTPCRPLSACLLFFALGVTRAAEPTAVDIPARFDQPVELCACDPQAAAAGGKDGADTLLPQDNLVDGTFDLLLGWKDRLPVPVTFGGWHWWTIDTTGQDRSGYGLRGFRGTYAYTVTAAPEIDLGDGQAIGAFVNFAARDGDPYRPFYSRNAWFLEGYGYYKSEELGAIKLGLVNTRFGLGNYLGFVGSAPYFDGFIQDPDYGISWEKTTAVNECLSLDTFVQYFIHDGEWNGSLPNHDQESVPGIHERNTFVARAAPKWKLAEDTTLALGMSGLVGEIDSQVPGFSTDMRSVWGTDATLSKGRWEARGEVLQWFGRCVPTRFASGGPSNRVTSFTTELGYKLGPVKYRGMYSASFDANPDGRQNIWSAGGVIAVTEHMNLFAEWADWRVSGHAAAGDFTVLQGPQFVVQWSY